MAILFYEFKLYSTSELSTNNIYKTLKRKRNFQDTFFEDRIMFTKSEEGNFYSD